MQRNPAYGLQRNKMGRPIAGSCVLFHQSERFAPRFSVLCLVLADEIPARDSVLMLSATGLALVAHLCPPLFIPNRSASNPSAVRCAEGYRLLISTFPWRREAHPLQGSQWNRASRKSNPHLDESEVKCLRLRNQWTTLPRQQTKLGIC